MYLSLHVTSMDHIRNQRQVMCAFVMQERMKMNEVEWRVDRRGGRGWRHRVDGERTSPVNEP